MSTLHLPAPAPSGVLRLPRLSRGGAQVALFFLAYLVYSVARWFTIGDLGDATANAHWIVDLEDDARRRRRERRAERADRHRRRCGSLNHLYLAAQLVVLPGALWLLHRKARPHYVRLRNTVLATWLLSIPVYGLFPVAPPRLADIGMVDTISSQTGFAMDSKLTTSFYNELAAVPEPARRLRVRGRHRRRRPPPPTAALKVAAHLWGPIVALAVVATGNHYVFDIAAGMVAAAIGYGLGALVGEGNQGRRLEPDGVDPDLKAVEDAEVRLESRSRERREQLARRDRRRALAPWLLCLRPAPRPRRRRAAGDHRRLGRRPARALHRRLGARGRRLPARARAALGLDRPPPRPRSTRCCGRS